MARYGQGKPMGEQADRLLRTHLSLDSRHAAKAAAGIHGSRSTGQIHSLATFQKYVSSLKLAGEWAKAEHGLRHLKALTPVLAQAYLDHRAAQGIGQKQLNADRTALAFLVGPAALTRVTATTAAVRQGRAYTEAQVARIMAAQTERQALATRIAHEAGLRAHELLTLRRPGEGQPTPHRPWRDDRFQGRVGVRYLVTGKGGLTREVLLSAATAAQLEARRLDQPRQVSDRGIHYLQRYDLGGGNAWSKSVQAAAQRALGWSTGAHGLRHSTRRAG